jgi:hypothetical protein
VFAAHEVPTTLRAIAVQIGQAHGRRATVVPVPGSLAHGALRIAEAAGLSLPFRSDSLASLMHPIPLDQVSSLVRSPVEFPPLAPELWLSAPPQSSPADVHTASAPAPGPR